MKTFVAEKFNNTCLFPWPFCTAWLAFTFAGSGVAGVSFFWGGRGFASCRCFSPVVGLVRTSVTAGVVYTFVSLTPLQRAFGNKVGIVIYPVVSTLGCIVIFVHCDKSGAKFTQNYSKNPYNPCVGGVVGNELL